MYFEDPDCQVVVEVPVEMDLQCEDPESEAQSQVGLTKA